jgi:hypothetical protein
VREDERGVPLVRTTSAYEQPPQRFRPVHQELVARIEACFARSLRFNNCMAELYETSYRKMGFHTDQAQDLEEDSWICLFSCYESPDPKGCRALVVQRKGSEECARVLLDHNSAVLFHTDTNRRHVHKIVLENQSKSRWLGLTFRCSKTRVRFVDGVALLGDRPLRLAETPDERQSVFHHKGAENATDGLYSYPELDYTLSPSDLMEPV